MNRLTILTWILFSFYFCSCSNNKSSNNDSKRVNGSTTYLPNQKVDSLELFFHSKGVVRYYPIQINEKTFEILNDDNTIYAKFDFSLDKLNIQGKLFKLSDFANDNSIKSQYHFFPKEFFPDQSIIQFEYTSLVNGIAEIYINKDLGIKKKIKYISSGFKAETWSEHLIGVMIDFNRKTNPIRLEMTENSKSLGYENSTEEYIFIIREVNGDWAKIGCHEICDYPCNSGKKYDGWIRWKNSSELLISIFYSC